MRSRGARACINAHAAEGQLKLIIEEKPTRLIESYPAAVITVRDPREKEDLQLAAASTAPAGHLCLSPGRHGEASGATSTYIYIYTYTTLQY